MKDKVLFVDDDQAQCELGEALLTRLGYGATSTTSAEHALELVQKDSFVAVVTDLGMTGMNGLELCERLIATRPDVPVIVATGLGSMETAILAIRAGAYDFLTKPLDAKLLGLSVARAAQHRHLQREIAELKELEASEAATSLTHGLLVGESPAMRRVYDLITRMGPSDASVLIQGETGSGKEVVARALHKAGPRRDGPFVAINCAALPPNLLESELFGYARGAFTDAKTARRGLLVEASHGTLLLDEIGEMPFELQAKLLRALQDKKVRAVGSNVEVPFDARIVAATHKDLEKAVAAREFRQDLYYRINVVTIDVPPLRDRAQDILKLSTYFLQKASLRTKKGPLTFSAAVAERLRSYEWPGNVRELENCIERAVALTRFDQLGVDDLPEKIRAYRADRFVLSADQPEEVVPFDELEKRYILRVLHLLRGNKSRAAQLLGLDRRTLYRKLDRYGDTVSADLHASHPDGCDGESTNMGLSGDVSSPGFSELTHQTACDAEHRGASGASA